MVSTFVGDQKAKDSSEDQLQYQMMISSQIMPYEEDQVRTKLETARRKLELRTAPSFLGFRFFWGGGGEGGGFWRLVVVLNRQGDVVEREDFCGSCDVLSRFPHGNCLYAAFILWFFRYQRRSSASI